MFAIDIKKRTKENTNFRTVLYTGKHSQIVAMSIPPGQDIGEETHADVDQMVFLVEGDAEAVLNGETQNIEEHDVVFVPAGTKHNFRNFGDEDIKLFTVYAPPEHPEGTVHRTKEEAQQAEEDHEI